MANGEFSPLQLWRDREEGIDAVVNDIVEGLGGKLPEENDLRAEVIYNQAAKLEAEGELPEYVTAWDVYDYFVGSPDEVEPIDEL